MSERQNDFAWFWNSDLYRRLQGMSCAKKPNLLKLLFAVHDEVRLHTPVLGWLLRAIPPSPKLEVECVICPAACQVLPLVSSFFSTSTQSVQPFSAR